MYDSTIGDYAQQVSITGITAEDSVIRGFTRSNSNGGFLLTVSKPGKYILLFTHPRNADRAIPVNIEATPAPGEIRINMISRAKALQEIVARRNAIKVKGDTTMYLADSFGVDANASVEELLKVLPGISVDKDGNITAQGEQVQKVLVDGEEFFGDDPKMVTKGLQAKTIERVEVYDDKGEAARFTGFDDGTREKTINLKMKKDMKRGTFGKVEGHADFTNFWNAAAMANSFKNNRKLSGFAVSSNTGRSGLQGNEGYNYGSGGGWQYDEDNDTWTGSGEDGGWGRSSSSNGLPTAHSAGVNYSNKFDEGKHGINGNASWRNNLNTQKNTSVETTFLESGSIVNTSNNQRNTNGQRYSGKTRYELIIDTSSSFNISVSGRNNLSTSAEQSDRTNTSGNIVVSSNNQAQNSNSNSTSGTVDANYKKKLKKPGRTIFINSTVDIANDKSNNTQVGNTVFGSVARVIDQNGATDNNNSRVSTKFNYTEPLIADKVLLEASYIFTNKASAQNTVTNARNTANTFEKIDSLSNDFESNILTNRAGIKISYQSKKMSINAGSAASYAIFKQSDNIRNLNYDYNRINFFPSLNLRHKVGQSGALGFNYNGNTSQPSITQLQQIVNNRDPLNITIGNPNLVQSYRQNFRLSYNQYKSLKESGLWANVSFSNTFKQIVTTQKYIPATGQNIYSYDNTNGAYNANGWAQYSFRAPRLILRKLSDSAKQALLDKPRKGKLNIEFGLSGSLGRNPRIVNDIRSFGQSSNINASSGIRYAISRKISIGADVDVTYNSSSNAVLNQRNNFWSAGPNMDFSIFCTPRLIVSGEVDYNWQQKQPGFNTQFNRALVDGNIEYRFLKNKNLVTRLSVLDALNQNTGYDRSIDGNTITEDTYLSLRRMILLGAIYNFSFGPAKKTFNEDGEFDD
ncbi:MAG: hypothetical protein RL660_660 [Bacteroidota bacterium]